MHIIPEYIIIRGFLLTREALKLNGWSRLFEMPCHLLVHTTMMCCVTTFDTDLEVHLL